MKKVLVILAVLLVSFGIYYLVTATKDYNTVLAEVNAVGLIPKMQMIENRSDSNYKPVEMPSSSPEKIKISEPVIYGKCPIHGDLSQWDIMRFSFKVGNVQATSERFCAHCVYQYIVRTLRQNMPAIIEVNGVNSER